MDYIEKRFCYTTPTDLNMYYCGKRIKTENHSYGPQVRDHFLLVYIKEGTATLTIGDSCFDLCGGQLLCRTASSGRTGGRAAPAFGYERNGAARCSASGERDR